MSKKKPTLVFNPANLTFEQKKISWKTKMVSGVLAASGLLVFGFICILISQRLFPSPNEQKYIRQLNFLKNEYQQLQNQVDNVTADLGTLRKRDENLYRVIYQRDPIDQNIWKTVDKDKPKFNFITDKSDYQVIGEVLKKLSVVKNSMILQTRSYNELANLVLKKDEMIKAIPSIQPITNKDLTRISSGFGWRLHPIYRVQKLHAGIDFAAPTGTDVFATGDGTIESCHVEGGYGNCIVINHGYGYKTRYAHLSRYNSSQGQQVLRGQKIGEVGSTGASVGPHVHYEVEFNNEKVDPALFFYNDLNSTQFEELINLTNSGGKSFD